MFTNLRFIPRYKENKSLQNILNNHRLEKDTSFESYYRSRASEKRSFVKRTFFGSPKLQNKSYSRTPYLPNQVARSSNLINSRSRSMLKKLTNLGIQESRQGTEIPLEIKQKIVNIFSQNGSSPSAIGILVSSNIILTARIAIPTPEIAKKCYYAFADSKVIYTYHSTITSTADLALLSISPLLKDPVERSPIPIESDFCMELGDSLIYISTRGFFSSVQKIEPSVFVINPPMILLAGAPIFDVNWHFQGVCISSATLNSRIANLNGIMDILKGFSDIQWPIVNASKFNEDFERRTESMVWLQWGGNYVEIYDVRSHKWIYNSVDRLDEEEEWTFPAECRTVPVPDHSIIIAGGTRNGLASNKAYKYSPYKNKLVQIDSMHVGRAATALVYHKNYVYAISGKFGWTFCERYSLRYKRWTNIPNCVHERHDLSAISIRNSIFVVGGEPMETIGNSIETYDINHERWSLLNIKLPGPMALSALCQVSPSRFVIIGGRFNTKAIIVDTLPYFHLEEISILEESVESFYPTYFDDKQVLVFNTKEGQRRPLLYKILREAIDL